VLLSISAVFFISATEACLKSYAWDYFSVPEERRRFEQLSDEFHYKDRCLRRSRLWHKLAVWAYSIGFVCVMLGVVVLFWTVSRITSIVVSISLLIALLTSVFGRFRPDDSERFVEFLQRRLL
jgi:Flp pilus assembly protein TadB